MARRGGERNLRVCPFFFMFHENKIQTRKEKEKKQKGLSNVVALFSFCFLVYPWLVIIQGVDFFFFCNCYSRLGLPTSLLIAQNQLKSTLKIIINQVCNKYKAR
jgi:hypothetical protein